MPMKNGALRAEVNTISKACMVVVGTRPEKGL